MKLYIETLGCKVNTYESEVIKEEFLRNGYSISNSAENADVIVINTCSVTNQSDAKSRKIIRSARKANQGAILVVCGCSAQNHKEDLKELGIDILLGNKDKSKIFEYVNNYNNIKINKFYDLVHSDFENMSLNNYSDRTRAFVKIQDGCNNYCSYCIIPYLRGTIRNKDFDTAVKEINTLVSNGFKEIVLTGIHTGSYDRFVELIREISKNEKLERIRISSIEATEIDDEFLKELKINNKICDHMHIPVQAACNNTLKKMNRKYDMDKYIEIINKLREIRPNINITTDLIVGFPTETEEDFKESLTNASLIKFGKIHVFPYSKRDGTVASKMNNIVSDIDKKRRTHEMIELSNKLENEYYNKFINKELDVLIEEVKDGISTGHTSNYIKVIINEELEHNKIYNVQIDKVDGINVYGSVVKDK